MAQGVRLAESNCVTNRISELEPVITHDVVSGLRRPKKLLRVGGNGLMLETSNKCIQARPEACALYCL